MTNLEGRVIRRRRALPPPVGVKDDLEMINDLATRLGRGKYFSSDPRQVFDELRAASRGGIADYSGITYEQIDAQDGVFWPAPAPAGDWMVRSSRSARHACSPTGSPRRMGGPDSSGSITSSRPSSPIATIRTCSPQVE